MAKTKKRACRSSSQKSTAGKELKKMQTEAMKAAKKVEAEVKKAARKVGSFVKKNPGKSAAIAAGAGVAVAGSIAALLSKRKKSSKNKKK